MKAVFLLLSLLLTHSIFAETPLSAKRDPLIDSSIYENETVSDKASLEFASTAQGSAIYYNEEGLPHPTIWSQENLNSGFSKIQERFIKWERQPDFLRKIFWLYPDDGCFARAALANGFLEQSGFSTPKTVFAFGNLSLKTENTPDGVASWWFHVAPIVEVDGARYVLDPAVNPEGPILLKEWLDKIGTPEKIRVAICGSGTYSPSSPCNYQRVYNPGSETKNHYLDEEWDQLKKIGKDPSVILQ